MDLNHLWDVAVEISDEAVDHFSTLHPNIRMNRDEWHDLREMIQREVVGHFSDKEPNIGAGDLLIRQAPPN